MQFVKDSFAAADAAGRLPPVFAEIEKASKSLKEEQGVRFARALEPAAKIYSDVATSAYENVKVTNDWQDAVDRGMVSQKEMNEMMRQRAMFGLDAAVAIEGLAEATSEYTEAEQEWIDTAQVGAGMGAVLAGMAGVPAVPVEIVPFFSDVSFFEGLDLGIGDAISSAMAQIDFAEAGGRELVAGFNEIMSQISIDDSYGVKLADQLFGEMFVQEQQIQEGLGNITAEEAAENIRGTLGVSLSEAEAKLADIEGTLRRIDGLTVKATIRYKIITTGQLPTVAGNVTVLGPEGGGSGGGQETSYTPQQHGGAVTAGNPYIVGEAGPEPFIPSQDGTIVSNNQFDIAGLKSEVAGLRGDIGNMVLDFQQAVVEAMG